ncbi:hypothetical protein [Corynebacterium glyciniphilum]|uniref:hypothetical protein n=1 Tax=Corynebacterium glyciniphilum TaxID=1404244 RepID=UPI003FD51193
MTAWSPRLRPSSDFAVTGEKRVAPLTDGRFEIDLVPGEVQLNISGNSQFHPLSLTIPTQDEPVDLLDLLEGDFEYAPEVVQAAQQAARDAREYLRQSREVAERFGSVERVGELEASARASATAADGHRRSSASSAADSLAQAARSKSEADRAESEASDIAVSAGAAEVSAGESAASAAASLASEESADGHRQAAASSASAASGSASTAGTHRAAAEAAAGRSESAADASASSAQSAESDADRADGAVRDAVVEVTGVTEGHKVAAEAAAGRAASSATAAESAQGRAEQAAEQAEDIATGDLPSASGSTRGLVRMTGDLSGTGDEPRVPALALAAPGASVCVTPGSEGWGNAVAAPAQTRTGWQFDGEWLRPPSWLGVVTVTLDWCGGTSAVLRGRRSDGNASTIATVPAGTPETHRQVTAQVDLSEFPALAVAGTWSPEDLEAGCTASLIVRPLPDHQHSIDDVRDLREELRNKVEENDPRLDDPRKPAAHKHPTTEVFDQDTKIGLDTILDRLLAIATRGGVWFTGDGPPPDDLPGARVGDYWYDETDEELHKITEVIDDDDSD